MSSVGRIGEALARARNVAGLSQRDLARRAGTAQSLVARIERGRANPTLVTLDRLFEAAGHHLVLDAAPSQPEDAVVEAFKRDVDRSLIRENLRRSVEDRLRLNADVLALVAAPRRNPSRRKP